jgi:uncharacterized protein YbcI
MQGGSGASGDNGQELSEISRVIVHLYKERLGHGPTRARAIRCTDDVVVCVMEGTLTTKERTLHSAGADQSLLESRTEVQEIIKGEIVGKVEAALGQPVSSVVGGIDLEGDVATLTFLLQAGDS